VNREPVPGECTQFCLGQDCQAVGTGIGENAIWDLLKSKKVLAHHIMVPSMGYVQGRCLVPRDPKQVQIACTPFESGVLQMAWWF